MFTTVIETEILIDAPPEATWAVLTDFEAYSAWNPFIRMIEGRLVPGDRLRVEMTSSPDAAPMRFTPRVLVADPARELRWLGRIGIPGLFDAEHRFCLSSVSGGSTRFIHSERFSGILVPVLRSKLLIDTARSFAAMNDALKARVEVSVNEAL